jgi:hypothetical protein
MTLILTELSQAGIAMAADSAISALIKGKIVTKDQKQWKKLLGVPRVKGGISYWGDIGLITKLPFDEWLERRIKRGTYTDLPSFADYLAVEMNREVGNKPLRNDHQVGVHVAGFQTWSDGVSRPTFYHIHNGHSHVVFEKTVDAVGDGQNVPLSPRWVVEPRELFTRHDDFSPQSGNRDALIPGYLTTNGDYATFHIIFAHLKALIADLNMVSGFSIPAGELNALGPRVGFLKTLIEITISLLRCSTAQRHIGGKVLTLGIRPDGTYI